MTLRGIVSTNFFFKNKSAGLARALVKTLNCSSTNVKIVCLYIEVLILCFLVFHPCSSYEVMLFKLSPLDYIDFTPLFQNFNILNEDDIQQRQEESVTQISTVLSISRVAASILLRHYNW